MTYVDPASFPLSKERLEELAALRSIFDPKKPRRLTVAEERSMATEILRFRSAEMPSEWEDRGAFGLCHVCKKSPGVDKCPGCGVVVCRLCAEAEGEACCDGWGGPV